MTYLPRGACTSTVISLMDHKVRKAAKPRFRLIGDCTRLIVPGPFFVTPDYVRAVKVVFFSHLLINEEINPG